MPSSFPTHRLSKLIPRNRRLLVIESDGFLLRAAVVQLVGGEVKLVRAAYSRQSDPSTALAEAAALLRPPGLPKRAILLTAEVTTGVLRLPIDPSRPRPAAEMQELIRWELEPQVAVHSGARPIGEILCGRGHLTFEQVTRVLAEQERLKSTVAQTAGRRTPVPRFGEVAIGMGLIMRGQVDEALEIQRRFQMPADDLICGFAPLAQAQSDEAGQWKWLACGLSRSLRERWGEAFEAQDLDLTAIYPLPGGSLGAAQPAAQQGICGLLEVQAGIIGAARLKDGKLDSWQWHLTAGHRPTAELCLDLLGSDLPEVVWFTGHGALRESLMAELATTPGLTVSPLEVPLAGSLPPEIDAGSLASLLGAARHAMLGAGSASGVCVAGHDPGPPLWKQPPAWLAAAMVVAAITISVLEYQMRGQFAEAVAARDQAQLLLQAREQEQAEAQGIATRAESLTKEIATVETMHAAHSELNQFLSDRLTRRAEFLPAMMRALMAAASDEVSVERIAESSNNEIQIRAWALSSKAAEEFAQKLHQSLDRWELAVTTRTVEAQNGRLGLPGYAVEVRLGAEQAKPAVTASSAQEKR